MTDTVARPGRGCRRLLGMVALVAATGGWAGYALAQANPSTAEPVDAGQIRSTSGAALDGGASTGPSGIAATGTGSTIESGAADDAAGVEAGVTYYDSPRTMFATTSSRVRSGPGTEHDPVATIPYAAEVAVLGDAAEGGWVYLEMSDGTRGFTAGRLLSAAPPAVTSSSTGATGTQGASSVTGAPTCISGEVLIQLGDGQSICAMLQ